MNDEAGNGVCRLIRQVPFRRPVQVTDRHGAIYQIMPILTPADRMIAIGVKFVGDFPDDLFEDVFERDQPLQ